MAELSAFSHSDHGVSQWWGRCRYQGGVWGVIGTRTAALGVQAGVGDGPGVSGVIHRDHSVVSVIHAGLPRRQRRQTTNQS